MVSQDLEKRTNGLTAIKQKDRGEMVRNRVFSSSASSTDSIAPLLYVICVELCLGAPENYSCSV
jgi:hypothetical protein